MVFPAHHGYAGSAKGDPVCRCQVDAKAQDTGMIIIGDASAPRIGRSVFIQLPVEGVEIAEEVNPTYVAPLPEVQTAGYDFYNSKSFDPFIATLNEDERNQFTEIFILRYHGMMPDIPDYQVGGDNAEFFRRIFIYLGQYRDRIPSGLLAKIYQYSLKLN